MITSRLTILLAVALVQTGVQAAPKRWDSPISNCRVTLDKYHFDLCPLLKERHQSGQIDLVTHYKTPPTITTIIYNVSLSGPLKKADGIPDDEQCAEGTWACMTTRNRRPGRDPVKDSRVTQLVPLVAKPSKSESLSASAAEEREEFGIYAQLGKSEEGKPPPLSLRMYGGYYVDKPQRVQINFVCSASDDDAPKYSWTWAGTHTFTWATKHGCAGVHATPPPKDGGDSDPPPAEIEEPPNDHELLPPPITHRRGGPSVTTVLLWSSAAVFALGYAVLHPPDAVRKRIRTLRRMRFLRGTGEAKLLQWASEDLATLSDAEEDDMVNSRPIADEQIPLRPSPTRLKFANYGTAR
ncbi:hypothetical protein BC834DRAFT_842993 [Gloeopeniophorella convolvens]|nr:hypothetical protein BC834DRAFT_842993 [Gloeopeniophorella convolvens]